MNHFPSGLGGVEAPAAPPPFGHYAPATVTPDGTRSRGCTTTTVGPPTPSVGVRSGGPAPHTAEPALRPGWIMRAGNKRWQSGSCLL